MDRRLDPKAVEPLIEVLAEDSSAAVRVAACQTLVELPVGAEVWEAAAPAVHSMLDDIPLGASEGGAALAAARLVPEQSVRERVPPAAPVEVDPMARLEARVALGDLAAVPELLGLLGTDGRDWAASLLARLPIEEAGVEPSALEPIFDTDVFGALAAARLGRTRPLAAVLKRICSDQPPEMFWGSPWTAYDWLAAVRPVPESLRSWLLARLDDELCHAAKILTWAVTGVADAQGHPLAVEPEDASRAEATADRPTRGRADRPGADRTALRRERSVDRRLARPVGSQCQPPRAGGRGCDAGGRRGERTQRRARSDVPLGLLLGQQGRFGPRPASNRRTATGQHLHPGPPI